jgi:hypothetical protein
MRCDAMLTTQLVDEFLRFFSLIDAKLKQFGAHLILFRFSLKLGDKATSVIFKETRDDIERHYNTFQKIHNAVP